MTMTLIDSTDVQAPSPNTGSSEFKKQTLNPVERPSFRQYLSDRLQPQADKLSTQATPAEDATPASIGQEIAAPPLTPGQEASLQTAVWPLQAVTLGPHLNVITPVSAAPDAQSLEAFALAQGLDEKAVHWLFGGNASLSTGNAATTDETGRTLSQAMAQANQHLQGQATGLMSSAMVDGTSEFENIAVPNQTSNEDVMPLQMLRMPSPAAVWIQRTVTNPAGTDPLFNAQKTTISQSYLDLGADWSGDVLQELLTSEGNTSSGASATGTQGTAYANFAARWDAHAANRADLANTSAPTTDLPDAAPRSENIQNLADKMGQAVGQRILSEMERGQWHLKLSLRPATLGHIEVEMRLRSGEFDAVFTAPHPVTRELLQEGLNKLRETLNQMGMNVANMNVGDGQTGKNGENSTPGSFRGRPASNQAGNEETIPETTRLPSVKDPQDGLDVLV